jgi:hypothetical protein
MNMTPSVYNATSQKKFIKCEITDVQLNSALMNREHKIIFLHNYGGYEFYFRHRRDAANSDQQTLLNDDFTKVQ